MVPAEDHALIIEAVEESVELVSNSQLMADLEAAGADEAMTEDIIAIYSLSRTRAFQVGMAFLIFVALVGLIMTAGLSDRKLVET